MRHGADRAILTDSHPHIGTDRLSDIIPSIRREIETLGGEIRFGAKLTGMEADNGVTGIYINGDEYIPAEGVFLCLGHSARDTFEMLYDTGLNMEAKAFAVGVRTEHNRKMIDAAMRQESASYKLTYHCRDGRGVYSFCMCPGGYVVNASSETGYLTVNGMSYAARDGANANSAMLVQVYRKDFDRGHPLDGFLYQEDLEHQAYHDRFQAPMQNIRDLLEHRLTHTPVLASSYPLGTVICDMHDLFAPFGVWQTYHMVFDPSYTTSVFYLCLIYGSILHISQQSKCKVLHYAIMIIISILAGLTGPRLLLVAMAPILVAAIITYFIRVREYKGVLLRKSFELRLLINSCLATLVVIIGYYINAVYLNKKYTFADSSQTWRSFSIADVCASLSDFLSNFGYVGLFYGEVDVMSIRGLVTGGLGILFAVLIIFMYIRLIGRVKKIDSPYRFLIISGISTIFICCIFFGLMEGLGGGNGGYYISIIAIIIVDAIIEIATEDFMFIYSRKIMTLSMLLGVAMLSVVHSKMFVENGGYRHPEGIEGVVAAIEENEAYNGYATFWNSSIITEISNGQIETWTVEDLVTSGLVVKPWFQNKSHITEKPEGKVFIAALTRDECANMISIPGMTDKLVYQVGDNNMVFIFENIDELMNYVPLAE